MSPQPVEPVGQTQFKQVDTYLFLHIYFIIFGLNIFYLNVFVYIFKFSVKQ